MAIFKLLVYINAISSWPVNGIIVLFILIIVMLKQTQGHRFINCKISGLQILDNFIRPKFCYILHYLAQRFIFYCY